MEKLMDTDPYNRAMPKKLIGDDMFGVTYPTCLAICQKQTDCDDCPIQEAFARLRRYEGTGLTPEQVMELKERDAAKAPEPAPLGMDGMVCLSCGKKAMPWDRFCGECGQRFWEDERIMGEGGKTE